MFRIKSKNLAWRILLYASLPFISLVIIAGAESSLVIGTDTSLQIDQLLGVFSSALELAATTLRAPFSILMVAFVWKASQREMDFRRIHIVVDTLLGVAVGVATYFAFAYYEPFQTYVPFIAACVGLAGVVSLSLVLASTKVRLPAGMDVEGVLWLEAVGFLLGAAGLYWANYTFYPGLYYALHLGVMYATFTLVSLGLLGLSVEWGQQKGGPSPRLAIAFAAVVVAAGVVALVPSDDAEPHTRSYSIVGQTVVLLERGESTTSKSDSEDKLPTDLPERDSYVDIFERQHSFPELPEDFELDQYNVLLVTTEALRFDQTTLGDSTLDTTLNLMRFGEEAYVNTRAYSPSSGTLHSMSSNLAMAHPSMLPLETWQRPWFGDLDDSVTTVAELFQDNGRSTFWVGHNHNKVLNNKINGLDQGFQDVHLIPDMSGNPSKTLDGRIAEAGIKRLKAFSAKKERFFGWIFFASPHGPYISHYPNWRQDSPLDRYRQEVAYADEQLGKVLDALRDQGLWDKTIVVFMSDHGEEFREHGGTRHKSTVYTEVTHVPFVLHIPGLPAAKSDKPMSTVYFWPWLLSRGDQALAEHAHKAIDSSIGPVIDHTEGGVLAELIGHDRMKSALIYPRMKINYDFISKFHELYDLKNDPIEQKNLFRSHEDASLFEQRMRNYRAFRKGEERHILAPEK